MICQDEPKYMIEKITDLILEYALQNVFASEEGRNALRLELYAAAKTLYDADPTLFDQATLTLLNDRVPPLESEDYQAKLQSAQIWHKNGFDTWVFRLRFYLNISVDADTDLLALKIKKAFSCQAGSFMERHDMRSDYERLFFQIFRTNALEDRCLRSALEKILSKDLVNDVDGVIAYVAAIEASNQKQSIPVYMKTIYMAVTNLSVIVGDGLRGWLVQNKLSTVNRFYNALKKIELFDVAAIILEILDYITDVTEANKLEFYTDRYVMEQIEAYEKRLQDSFRDDELQVAAENYLRKHHKSREM